MSQTLHNCQVQKVFPIRAKGLFKEGRDQLAGTFALDLEGTYSFLLFLFYFIFCTRLVQSSINTLTSSLLLLPLPA